MSKHNRKDIKKAIKAFINHVESLEKAESIDFDAEYKLIQDAQARNKRDNVFLVNVGKAENNLKKNRYKDILPYDDHRVVLSVLEGEPDSDYINASKLTGVRGTGGYIATQGPLASTVNDFWRMIWEYNVEIIFMACRIVEMGKIKCKQYWNDPEKSDEFGDITVYTETEEKIMSDCVQRNFRVTRGEEVKRVIQYHYSGWPDHGIPDDAGHIRDMIGFMRQSRHIDQAPLLVHCSAGCGRTGAIIAIDHVWTLLEEGKFDEKFSLFDLICNFREQRMSIVQTAEQYALVNKVLKSLCEEWLTKMASHTYENVQLDEVSGIERLDVSSMSGSGENPYQDACSNDNHYQNGESVFSTEKSAIKEKRHMVGAEMTQPSQVKMVNSSSGYENIFKNEGKKQDDLVPQKPLLANSASSEKVFHKTVTQINSDSLNKQAQTTNLGGKKILTSSLPSSPNDSELMGNSERKEGNKELLQLAQLGPTTRAALSPIAPKLPNPVANGQWNETAYLSEFPKQQQLTDTFVYSIVNKKNPKSATEDTSVYSIVHKKAFKAPVPPSSSLKPQYISDEVTYSVVNKTSSPIKSQGEVTEFPSHQSWLSSTSDDSISAYSLASEMDSGSVFSAYEVFDFPASPNSINQSTSSVGSSGGWAHTNLSLSSKQFNLGDLPGFKDRLPRVRGPKPLPESWTKI